MIFTLPALIFLGFDLESTRIFALALFGGWLGVLFMIPLRRQLIVEEHENLVYPEGTACADVLMAGERGGSFASRVFLGLGLGGLYTLFQNDNLFALWPSQPDYQPDYGVQRLMKGSAIRADCTPEYLGVGYIIGIRVAAVMLAGGVFSWLVLMPAIYFFGSHLSAPLYPGTVLVKDMSPSDMWRTYVRPMGAGAVAAAGLITLLRTAPTIFGALTQGLRNLGNKNAAAKARPSRTEHDLPPLIVFGGSLAVIVLMFLFLEFKPVPGAQVGALANLAAALLVVVFGFLFVTVSARIVGIVGSSASPVSGMTIATLMATAAIFLVKGWTAPAFGALAITIGGVVCVAASNAGDTSQDLKTGYLIGATPWKQQIAIMIGVIVSIFSIGATLNAMNDGLEQFQRLQKPISFSLARLPDGVQNEGPFKREKITLTAHNKDNPAREELSRREPVRAAERNRLDQPGRREVPLQSNYGRDRGPVDSGHRQRKGGGSAGPSDGHCHQWHSQPQAALGAGHVRGCAGDCRGAARSAFAYLRSGRVPEHCDHACHLCRRRDAVDGGSGDGEGPQSGAGAARVGDQSGQPLCLGLDCGGRNRGFDWGLHSPGGGALRAAWRALAAEPVQRSQPAAS